MYDPDRYRTKDEIARWRERDPGTWLYHCHVESHMMAGMIGTYQVSKAR